MVSESEAFDEVVEKPFDEAAEMRLVILRMNAVLDQIEPFIQQLPELVEEFRKSPIARMLGVR